jgi:hypothetical protein
MMLVYLVGVVLSVVHFKRIGKPALFALAGCGTLFLIAAVFPFIQGYLLSGDNGQRTIAERSLWMGVAGLVRMLLQAAAFALLLAAIFVDRSAPADVGYEEVSVPEVDFPKGDPGRRSSV